jgi:hypothetical protein
VRPPILRFAKERIPHNLSPRWWRIIGGVVSGGMERSWQEGITYSWVYEKKREIDEKYKKRIDKTLSLSLKSILSDFRRKQIGVIPWVFYAMLGLFGDQVLLVMLRRGKTPVKATTKKEMGATTAKPIPNLVKVAQAVVVEMVVGDK